MYHKTMSSPPRYNLVLIISPCLSYQVSHLTTTNGSSQAGLSNGTWRNKALQATEYIDYMERHNAVPLRPKQYLILSYILHLQTRLKSTSAIMNYISGTHTWVQAFDGVTAAFDTNITKLLK